MAIPDRFTENHFNDIRTTPSEVLSQRVYETDNPTLLRLIGKELFRREASVQNDNPDAPFILWPAINKEPRQPWLPVLLAKTAKADFHDQLQDTHLVIVGPPASATWYIEYVQKHNIFPGARFPRVLKEAQIKELGLDTKDAQPIEVTSYVHNRQLDGSRGTQTMHIFDQHLFMPNGLDVTLLLLDDAMAEGKTAEELAREAKKRFPISRVLIASPMAKLRQGGKDRLLQSPYIDGVSTIVDVVKTHGKGQPIDIA